MSSRTPLSVKNLGPCNADGVVLTDTLPAGVSLEIRFRANPSSMLCTTLPSGPGTDVRCELTANIGVPGNVSLELHAAVFQRAGHYELCHRFVIGSDF